MPAVTDTRQAQSNILQHQDFENKMKEFSSENSVEQTRISSEQQAYARTTVDFALCGIRSLYVVNAGAIGILPLYWGMLDINFAFLSGEITMTIMFFTLSLLLTFAANFLAYYTEAFKSEAWQYLAPYAQENVRLKHLEKFMDIQRKSEVREQLKDFKKKHEIAVTKANKSRIGAIITIILALFLLVTGCLYSIKVVKKGTDDLWYVQVDKSKELREDAIKRMISTPSKETTPLTSDKK